ncbi:hypothetical protein Halru_1873 [Halovivax ruber XH-70]|uniref:Uncharacterized protein n=1 Tax=Halovivax ruber (strain DSM 18193 / JCM 13892 / XH-70) TaxID=797302 RepID=L0IES8_HALRX|nr:DUF5820 family protein [Halovivax ruber]AGB16472.1 hypothetical protein Halru_1873 [Halovivax ruber XH-70]
MTPSTELPPGWVVWDDESDGRTVYAYRPDVFDGSEYPAPCLPVCYLTHGARTRRPGQNPTDRTVDDDWFVTLYLEPEVYVGDVERVGSQADAESTAIDLLTRFAAGEIDYRAAYQVPRDRYLDRLDELTGRSSTR